MFCNFLLTFRFGKNPFVSNFLLTYFLFGFSRSRGGLKLLTLGDPVVLGPLGAPVPKRELKARERIGNVEKAIVKVAARKILPSYAKSGPKS